MATKLTLILALAAFGIAAWTAQLGGRIMHPETTGQPVKQQTGTSEKDADDSEHDNHEEDEH